MRDPVNINCTWHWIDVHGKKKKKKIYTFIILKIEEVPPVIIKSTVESERLETLNVLSTGFQHPENTVFIFLLCAQNSILSSSTCDCLRALVDLREYDRWGAPVSSPERRQRRGRPVRKQKKHHPPQTHTHPTNPKVPSHTHPMSSSGGYPLCICPFYKSTINSS